MPKGDYPTGALVEVIREYKADGGDAEVHEQAKSELKNLLERLVRFERLEELSHIKYSALQKWQKDLPEPYRTECCNILANYRPDVGEKRSEDEKQD